MSLIRITEPQELPLSLAELRAHLRLIEDDGTDEDALIMGYLRAAVGWIDGADGWLGRCLITQTWELKTFRFPARPLIIPLPPLQSIESITYLDTNGAQQTLASDVYQVVGATGSMPAKLMLAYDKSWPATRTQADAITIRFTAGFGDTWNEVPEPIRHALMMLVGYWFSQREAALIDPVIVKVPYAVEALLNPWRIWSFAA